MAAPLFDPGKTYVVVQYGPYAGRYPVFRSVDAFCKEHPGEHPVAPWWKGERGDWILCDDGHVAQVIRAYWLGNPMKRRRLTRVVRVAWTSAPYYERKDGTSVSRLEFKPKVQSKASMARPGTGRHGKYWNSKKKYFAWLVVAKGLVPYQAYMIAFKTVAVRVAKENSRYLMKEDRLLREVADIYKKLFDAAGMTDEDIASQIADIAKSNKSGKTRLDALRLALELRGEAPSGTNVNVRFPQLPASPASAPAGTLKAPPRQLTAGQDHADMVVDDGGDMQEAEVVDDGEPSMPRPNANGPPLTEEIILSDIEMFRLPNGVILATGNPRYLDMQFARSLEKLEWARRERLIKRRKGETILTGVTTLPNPESQAT